MCGIAAFSAPVGSKVNARHLAHHLLTQIEDRGSHASGFAYIDADGTVGMYKNPTPGSQLSLHELPRNARTVIMHTRYATQGSPQDNRNNHPVVSTDNNIAVVHNGVISNDYSLRSELGITERHGEVDSLVIPSLIAQAGTAGLHRLAGYAAIAWLDVNNPEELRIARLKSSPVAYTHLSDGTFVMASTTILLNKALLHSGYSYGGVFELGETRMITVRDGFISNHDRSPSMTYDYGSYRRHSDATSGGKSAAAGSVTTTHVRGSEDAPKKVFIPGSDEQVEESAMLADLEEWRRKRDEDDSKIAMAMVTGVTSGWTTEEWDEYIQELELRDGEFASEDEAYACTMSGTEGDAGYGEGFYILDAEGDISHYAELDMLEAQLKWYSEMSRTDYDIFPGAEDSINWVNHIMDLGSVNEDGTLVSWVDDSTEIDEWESPAVRNLQYIREGVQHYMSTLKGA